MGRKIEEIVKINIYSILVIIVFEFGTQSIIEFKNDLNLSYLLSFQKD